MFEYVSFTDCPQEIMDEILLNTGFTFCRSINKYYKSLSDNKLCKKFNKITLTNYAMKYPNFLNLLYLIFDNDNKWKFFKSLYVKRDTNHYKSELCLYLNNYSVKSQFDTCTVSPCITSYTYKIYLPDRLFIQYLYNCYNYDDFLFIKSTIIFYFNSIEDSLNMQLTELFEVYKQFITDDLTNYRASYFSELNNTPMRNCLINEC